MKTIPAEKIEEKNRRYDERWGSEFGQHAQPKNKAQNHCLFHVHSAFVKANKKITKDGHQQCQEASIDINEKGELYRKGVYQAKASGNNRNDTIFLRFKKLLADQNREDYGKDIEQKT